MKKSLLSLFGAVLLFVLAGDVAAQGLTTATMRGRVTDSNGDGLPGATVKAVHNPTNSVYGNTTDVDGFFRMSAMQVGGPYTVTISFVGFESDVRSNVFLSLGQTFNINSSLSDKATELDAVIVSATAGEVFDANRTGAATFISLEKINSTPTVSRSIGDFARFTPQASLTEGNDGLEISLGGMNNRLNAIYIDGAVNNDVFGLAGSGTNGGQTGVSPISLDAIEQFQVSIAPFDVRQSGFAGGSISAITRSGSNDVKASVYGLTRNQSFVGLDPIEDDQEFDREKPGDFSATTTGAWISGPLVKDKVFFFVSAEFQRDETPQPFNLANYQGDILPRDINGDVVPGGVDQARSEIQRLGSYLSTNWGYDIGDWENNVAFLNSNKILAKLDFNINDNNKLTIRHSFNGAENLEARASSTSGLRFTGGSEYFVSNVNSSALELKTNIGNSAHNHLTIGSTLTRDDRDPFGDPFPAVFIDDGRGGFTFGAETFSTANLLDQDVITINDNLELYKGKHTLVFGLNLEFYRAKNLFIPFNYGDYGWEYSGGALTDAGFGSNLDAFVGNAAANDYIRSYSLRDNVTGDESLAGVEFSSALYGFYVQDEFQASENLRLTFGLRGDVQTFDDTPINQAFNTTSIPLLEANYDLQGAQTGSFIKPQLYVSPRFGFNWDVNGDQSTQVRGGAGVFTSRVPLVWPGGAFNNNGVNRGTVLDFQLDSLDLQLAAFDQQPPGDIDPNNPTASGDIDLFSSDFKIPQVAKINLAVDQKLPWGLIATVEGLFTKFLNAAYYQNVNLGPSTGNITAGPDTRPVFNRRDEVDDTYGRIMLGSNTSKGYAYNISASLLKGFDNGFSGSFAYSYGDAYTIYDGTSSQNSSQWRGIFHVNGRNDFNEAWRSDFSQGHRVISQVSYRKEYAGFMASQISLVYEGRSGNPYTYIIGNGQNMINDDSRNRTLFYVPATAGDLNLVDYTNSSGDVVTAAEQWTQLNEFIEGDDYLSDRRGDYVERNGNRNPFEGVMDLRFLQDFYLEGANGKRNNLQLSVDIFNFTNLISSTWGKRYQRQSGGIEITEFEGFAGDGTTPEYTYRGITNNEPWYANFDDAGVISARWQMQVGVRYTFN